MISGYFLVLSFFCGAIFFVAAVYSTSKILQTQKPNSQKLSAYECGEDGTAIGKTSFNFRYFLPAIIFLLFEVEIVLLAPIMLAQNQIPEGLIKSNWLLLIKSETVLFLIIVILGIAMGLALKYFDWERPPVKSELFESPVPDFAYEQFNILQENKWAESKPEKNIRL